MRARSDRLGHVLEGDVSIEVQAESGLELEDAASRLLDAIDGHATGLDRLHDGVEIVRLGFKCRRMTGHSCAVDEDVEWTDIPHHVGDAVDIGNVQHQGFSRQSFVADRRNGLVKSGLAPRRADDMGPGFGQCHGASKPYAARCAGDQRPAPVQPKGWRMWQVVHAAAP